MNIMTSRPRTRVSVEAPFGGVTGVLRYSSFLSDVSAESAGSSFSRVILIGLISIEVLVALEVGAAAVASLAGVHEFDTHSSSESDLSESSPPPVFRSRVASRSSSPTTSTLEIPTAPLHLLLPHPGFVDDELFLSDPGRTFPLVRTFNRTHPDHSSSEHSISGHSLSGHASPDTTVADLSTPLRFVYPPLARTPRCSEAYLRWRSTPLSTMYPPTTSESSAGDSSFESSAGPSRKRCRSHAATVTSSIHATRALVPSRADLLPPRKRFRDSISPEDIDRDVVTEVDVGIDMEVDVRVDVEDEVEDEVESSDRGTIEVGVDFWDLLI
ncbi:hypothetical protein Tco_0785167 [Tanacetum coccineum]